MEEIKVSVKNEAADLYQFDVRMGGLRTRPTVDCSEQVVNLILRQIELVNKNPEIFNIDEFLVFEEYKSKVYELYGINICEDNLILDKAITETTKILKTLKKKMKVEVKGPASTYMQNIRSTNNSIIKMLLMGQFGTGKSTLVKKMSDIPEYIDFPVVDTARTTIHDANYIYKNRLDDSRFCFAVDFKTTQEIFNLVQECYIRAIDKLFDLVDDMKDDKISQDKVMAEFVTDPDKIFKIEYVLGKYYEIDNKKRELEEKKNQVIFWDNIFHSIYSLVKSFVENEVKCSFEDEENTILIEKDIRDKFLRDQIYGKNIEALIWKTVDVLQLKIHEICEDMEKKEKGNIVWDENEIVGFVNRNYIFEDLEEYIRPFSSTSIKHFTNIITPLVDSLVIEIPYNKNISSADKEKMICITDTVGFEHRKTDDTGSLEGSTKYFYNNYDIIGILDSAKQSMNGTTENLLREVYNNADKSKLMMIYTFYDEFTKKDFEDEHDKQFFLLDLQKTTLKKIDNSDECEKFIETFQKRTNFLSGLMSTDIECINLLLDNITKHYSGLYNYKKLDLIDPRKPIIEYNYRRLALVFTKAQEEYIEQQKYLYLISYPGYKTTEALTNRLKNGGTYFLGTSRTLKPVDDFCNILMEKIERFIKNPDYVNFEIKSTIPNHKEKVVDWFKEEVSSIIKKLAKEIFVDIRLDAWNKLYSDWGSGVDLRRRNGIIKEINNILPELIIDESTFADRWLNYIENIFEQVLLAMKNYR